MCTYSTVTTSVEGSAKGSQSDWTHISHATVYFDHPVHAMAEHTLNIDLRVDEGSASRVAAIELTAESARALVGAIESALTAVPAGLEK